MILAHEAGKGSGIAFLISADPVGIRKFSIDLQYIDKLRPQCEEKAMSYEEKKAAREAEIAGVTLLTCIRLKCTTMFDGCNTVRHAGCTEAAHQDVSSSGSSDSA